MTISDISEKYGLTKDTLRYYEKEGIIPPVPRDRNGFRVYDEEAEGWVEFAVCMRDSGVSIASLARYVKLAQEGDETTEERRSILIEERDMLEERMKRLVNMKKRLDYKIENYDKWLEKMQH